MTHKNETAARSFRLRDGGKTEKLGSTSFPQIYTSPAMSAMPSTERSGLMARVIPCNGRLFAVGHFAGGAS